MDYFGNDFENEPSLEQINGGKRRRSPVRSRKRTSRDPQRKRGRKYARKLPRRSAGRYYSRRASRGGKKVFVRRSKYNRAGARKSRHSIGMGSLMRKRSKARANYKKWYDVVKPAHLNAYRKRRRSPVKAASVRKTRRTRRSSRGVATRRSTRLAAKP
jgi:hypothetical protein